MISVALLISLWSVLWRWFIYAAHLLVGTWRTGPAGHVPLRPPRLSRRLLSGAQEVGSQIVEDRVRLSLGVIDDDKV